MGRNTIVETRSTLSSWHARNRAPGRQVLPKTRSAFTKQFSCGRIFNFARASAMLGDLCPARFANPKGLIMQMRRRDSTVRRVRYASKQNSRRLLGEFSLLWQHSTRDFYTLRSMRGHSQRSKEHLLPVSIVCQESRSADVLSQSFLAAWRHVWTPKNVTFIERVPNFKNINILNSFPWN